MPLTIKQIDDTIKKTFFNMQHNEKYILKNFWISGLNTAFMANVKKDTFIFSRKGNKLFINNSFIIEMNNKRNLKSSFAETLWTNLPFIKSSTSANAIISAFQFDGLEKLE